MRRLATALSLTLAACSNLGPEILTIGEQRIGVNETLTFPVEATDPDSTDLKITMDGAPKHAELNQIAGKQARFTFSPDASQVGVYTITFTATDGPNKDTETVNIKVVGGGAPVIVSATSWFFTITSGESLKVPLEWKDDDAATLEYTFEPNPEDWGAEISPSGKRVTIKWSPTDDQLKQTLHTFVATAKDPEGNTAEDTIKVVFRGGSTSNCPPGLKTPEVMADDIPNQATEDDYEVSAICTDDDTDIHHAVVFYTTVAEPTDSDWEVARLSKGGANAWTGVIPNLGIEAGGSQTVTWHVCAADDDDPQGQECDHETCSENKTFTASAPLGICDACNGGGCGDGGLCLRSDDTGEYFCGKACGTGRSCPAGYFCQDVGTSNGVSPQCIPNGCRSGSTDPAGCSCAASRPVPPGPDDLVVNEVLFDPPDACPDGQTTCETTAKLVVDVNGDGVRKKDEGEEEFVEILNTSATKYLQLEGVTIADTDRVRFTFPQTVLGPKKSAVVFGGGDATKFGAFGGAARFSSATTPGSQLLTLNNSGDKIVIALAGRTITESSWTSSIGKTQSIVREKEGDKAAALKNHSTASGASGAKWSPGTHVCGVPFPVDIEACIAPACAVTNSDNDPANDTRSTGACLKPLPQTVSGKVAVNQASAAQNDPKDLYVIELQAGKWLHARVENGATGPLDDSVLRLLARNGTKVADNDDDAWGLLGSHARIVKQIESDGIYYLEVSPYIHGTDPRSGTYKLTVESLATEPHKP